MSFPLRTALCNSYNSPRTQTTNSPASKKFNAWECLCTWNLSSSSFSSITMSSGLINSLSGSKSGLCSSSSAYRSSSSSIYFHFFASLSFFFDSFSDVLLGFVSCFFDSFSCSLVSFFPLSLSVYAILPPEPSLLLPTTLAPPPYAALPLLSPLQCIPPHPFVFVSSLPFHLPLSSHS